MDAGAIKAGSTYVEATMRDASLIKGMRNIEAHFRSLVAKLQVLSARMAVSVGSSFKGMGIAFAAMGSKVVGGVTARFEQLGATLRSVGPAMTRVSSGLNQAGTTMQAIGTRMVTVGAAFALPFGYAIKQASDAQETIAMFRQVFAEQGPAAEEFANRVAKGIGRSRFEIMKGMATYQAFFVGLGFGASQSREFAQELQSLTLDLAAFRNISDQESMERFISAMAGSPQVMDQFGVNIREATIQQELFNMGIQKSVQNATEQEKTLARLAIITRALGQQGAIGAAEREAGNFASRMKALQAAIQDAAIELGMVLLPAMTTAVNGIVQAINAVTEFIRKNQDLVVAIALDVVRAIALGAALVAIGVAVKAAGLAIAGIVGIFTAFVTVIGFAIKMTLLLLNPFVLLGLAVVALGAYLLYSSGIVGKTVKYIGEQFAWLFSTFKTTWGGIVDAIKSGNLRLAFEILVAGAKTVWLEFKNWMVEKFDAIGLDWFDLWKSMKVQLFKSLSLMLTMLQPFLSSLSMIAQMNLPGFASEPLRNSIEAAQRVAANAQAAMDRAQMNAQADLAAGDPEAQNARNWAKVDLEVARRQLEDLRAEAKKELEKKAEPVPPGRPRPPNIPGAMAAGKSEAMGSFSAFAVKLLGASGTNVQDKQLDVLKNIDKNGAEVANAVRRGNGLVFA